MYIVPTDHAVSQMRRRRITWEDIRLVLELGVHVDGLQEGTLEACTEIDGRPITVVYNELEYRFRNTFVIVTVMRRMCRGMRTTYDRRSDSLAIVLANAEVEETKNIAPGVEVDYDSSGRVVAIEVLRASDKYEINELHLEEPDPYLSLAEAGDMVGISPTTLRHQIARGVLPGTKIGRNWAVHQWDLFRYANERSKKAAAARSGQ